MILIIDDCIETKVGTFLELLGRAGFETRCATTLEEATEILGKDIDKIDAIILDYSFPVSQDNQAVYDTNRTPNGIVLLQRFGMKLKMKDIPVIINTDGEESYRDDWLRKTTHFKNDRDVLYKSPEKQPISCITPLLANKLIEQIKQKKEERDLQRNAPKETKKWPKAILEYYR